MKVIGADDKASKTVVGTLPPLSAVTYVSLGPALEAVNSGVEKVVIDMSRVLAADASVVKFGLTVAQTCEEFSLKQRMVGTDAISLECKNYEETKDWRFESSFEEALAALNGSSLASEAA